MNREFKHIVLRIIKKTIIGIFLSLTIEASAMAAGFGDGVLHLGPTGYASLPSASVVDLDYARDFSVEAVVNIEPNSVGGRWAPILAKTSSVFDNSSGFAIGFDQGCFNTFGQQIVAKIGDGVNGINVTSPSYQGTVHVVMAWSAAAKTMNLYINGARVATKTNTAIALAGIKNSKDLVIGAALSYQRTLARDVLLGRLWNRSLTGGEASALYHNFSATGSHLVPSGFSTAGLISEWLMLQTSNASGGDGTTNIKDTAGRNHLNLKNGAALYQGDGGLTSFYPAEGSINISPAVTLRASGGLSLLGPGALRGLSYEFQIDETNIFNSAALKDSGWVANFASYKPILKPDTTYYWHVRVKDSSVPAKVSAYGATLSFKTRASLKWYARPGVYTGQLTNSFIPVSQKGVYGTQNGRSYANAWNGIRDIVWGENGVAAGDDLYICGTHILTISNNDFWIQYGQEIIPESGYAPSSPITIRMDYPNDTGILWGVWKDNRTAVTWSGPDSNGVYSTSNLAYSAAAQMVSGRGMVWLNKATASTWAGNPGATYTSNGVTYIKTVDGSHPAGRIYSGGYGFSFDLSRSSYIKFYKANFYNSVGSKERVNDTLTKTPPSHDITYDSSVFKYNGNSYGDMISLYGGHNKWVIKNSEIAFSVNGIYLHGEDTYNGIVGPVSTLIYNNRFHDIGFQASKDDCHAIGVQSGKGHTIEKNEIWNDHGTAIEFWTGSRPMTDMIVRHNFIHDIYADMSETQCITSASGITVSGDNEVSVQGLRSGFKIYGNIIMNTGIGAPASGSDWHGRGIASTNKDPMKVFNNVLYNTRGGISIAIIQSSIDKAKGIVNIAQGNFNNNVIIKPWGGQPYINVSGPTNAVHTANIDYNLFYPAASLNAPNIFNFYPLFIHDTHSLFADLKFVSAAPVKAADFNLKSGSPAIAHGVNVGLTADFAGNPIPGGNVPVDIGAFQYVPSLTVTLSGIGSGTITSNPSGINCGSACRKTFTPGTTVTLSASPQANSTFTGWSGGGCSGTGTCVVKMTSSQTVTAKLTPTP